MRGHQKVMLFKRIIPRVQKLLTILGLINIIWGGEVLYDHLIRKKTSL